MFSSKPRATIKIQPYQGIFHLHPPSEYPELEEDPDETFWGNVVLSLPKPREIKSLVVKLNAHYSVAVPGHSTETGILNTWECDISVPPTLEKGEHSFAWSLRVPRSSAPYERCAFGRVYYKLLAVATVVAPSHSKPDTLKDDVFLEVVISPSAAGDTGVLSERIEGFHPDVGPYLFSLASQHLTVGGVMHFSLTLASVPNTLRVQAIGAHIMQSYTLQSHATPGRSGVPPAHKRMVFYLDHRTPLWQEGDSLDAKKRPPTVLTGGQTVPGAMAQLEAGETLAVSHVARLPDDDLLRASTHTGTRAPIRISHRIVLELTFSTSDGAAKILRAERPLTILSCGCLPEDLTVPPYDEKEVEGPKKKLKEGATGKECTDYYVCVCCYTLESLLHAHDAPLLKAHEAVARPKLRPEDVFVANKRHTQESVGTPTP
ncbi:hypothetical protein EXIGLDRAFT_835018 [Exidia glandulosa HHB12029]|uniref:Arrestin-like N-terminal domain-containing protein n=1 Tax=Exidia glandulosa HHB12029 TaxID=1314781 RepID=A0A166ARB2_EXIGL|nr:hypothetical protein EXIGLDRAFT_835018 [Exidia glandulosa HHB12029]